MTPVVRYNSVGYLIALAVKYDLEMDQMDAISDNEIYMSQPIYYAKKTMCKSIYGLKQTSRQWNLKSNHILLLFNGLDDSEGAVAPATAR